MGEQHAQARAFAEQRSGYRVHCVLPLRINGRDSGGKEFSAPARTEIITRDGGLIVCSVSLEAGAQVTLHNGDKQALVRVVANVRVVDESIAYGVNFVRGTALDFWGIRVSDPVASAAVGRTVLECSKCHSSHTVELGEIEMVVLEKIHVLGRFCQLCVCETLWEPPQKLGDKLLVTGSAAYSMATVATERRQRSIEDRKHRRLSMKRAQACIKAQGKPDDIVYVVDFSRGGVRFMSTVDYQPGAQVQVAVPYTHGGANIYVPAVIRRVILRARAAAPGDYACEYITKA